MENELGNLEEDKREDSLDEPNGDYQAMSQVQKTIHLSGMFENWFLDYASYVILERAVPDINDGFKPVQRRLMHAMKELDDGRFNKVANIIGHTMKYHPHGDASIGDALVQMGQKDLLVETQGNWGNILTGDGAAAPRYIEARLSKFALDVVFNPKTTHWKLSYDGRNQEPLTLPVKFPLLLAQGAEGIAVGLASKILPHNFLELIDACIDYFNGVETMVYPDFPTGGLADFSRYNNGLRGGRVRLRARISLLDKKTLVITEVPFGTNTSTLIESILAANEKGKIKIRKIDDNTAENVEILIHLVPGVSPDTTMDALYAFTDCEVSLSPNSCVIEEGRPWFAGVSEILARNAKNIIDLLKLELEIKRAELLESWHFSSLEKIFIEKRIYLKIEQCETWEAVIEAIDTGLQPYKKKFKREIVRDDIIRLTEIKIKRISKFDGFKADEHIKDLEKAIEGVDYNLAHLTQYAIDYMVRIREKYGKGRERKTEIRNFESIEATAVAAANQKLYVNRAEGFIGTSLKKDEFVSDCSDIDDIIVFREDGTYFITKVGEKVYVGTNVIHIAVFKKNDERTIYNAVYQDGKKGFVMMKRFAVLGVTRDKEYNLTKGSPDSRVLYFTANPNGEAEVIQVHHRPKPKLKKLSFEFDMSQLAIKNRNSMGNILTRNPIRKILKKEEGISTLRARQIWWDEVVHRLNAENRGLLLGAFEGEDKILTIYQSGTYRTTNFDLGIHFEEDLIFIRKFKPGFTLTAMYLDPEGRYYIKRFQVEVTDKKVDFIGEDEGNKLVMIWPEAHPILQYSYQRKNRPEETVEMEVDLTEFIGVKGVKAKGKRVSDHDIFDLKGKFKEVPREEPEEPAETEFPAGEEPVASEGDAPAEGKEDSSKKWIDTSSGDSVQMTLEF
jgi:topoisomerase-4 subunit A